MGTLTAVGGTLRAVGGALVGAAAGPTVSQFVADGAWCWFNEPRLLCHQGTKSQLYGSYVTSTGDVSVSSVNTDTGVRRHFTLHADFEIDDHDVPGMIVLPDGRLMALYSRHNVGGDGIYVRVSANPEDVASWGPVQKIAVGAACYPKPALVGSRLYVFYRINTARQDFVYSDDLGATWSAPKTLFANGSERPYVNYSSDHLGRVDFIATDGHPRELPSTDLYHWYLSGDSFYRSDGTLISTVAALPAGGLTPADVTVVYDNTEAGKAWGWDITRDGSGNPVVVFAVFPTVEDHRYRYARWTGSAWVHHEITPAGGPIGNGAEDEYSGGLSLLRTDPATVYLSRQVSGQFEIQRWTTPDGGATWRSEPITSGSSVAQVRPTCPRDAYPGAPEVVWMSGTYTTFIDYDTALMMSPAPVSPPPDVTAPSVPTGLVATGGSGQVTLTWSASTDDHGVTGYNVYRGGVLIGSATGLSYVDAAVTAGVEYSYTVSATDGVNESGQSAADTATPTVAVPPTFDATSSATPNSTGTLTWTHIVGSGSNRLLIVQVGNTNGATESVTDVTFGGVAMTHVEDAVATMGSGQRHLDMWAMVNPPSGAGTVVATFAAGATAVAEATSYAGVNQETPYRAAVTDDNSTPVTSVSTTVTGVAESDLIHSVCFARTSVDPAPGPGQTQRFLNTFSTARMVGTTQPGEADGSVTSSFSWTTGDAASMITLPLVAT